MPKYEDFKVGDVWICRDATEVVITRVDAKMRQSYPIITTRGGVTEEGFYRSDKAPHDGDLMHLKLDLTKPLRFIGTVETFSAAEIENAPEPVVRTLKQWAVIAPEGGVEDFFDTYEEAREAFAHGQIVEMTGEYHV